MCLEILPKIIKKLLCFRNFPGALCKPINSVFVFPWVDICNTPNLQPRKWGHKVRNMPNIAQWVRGRAGIWTQEHIFRFYKLCYSTVWPLDGWEVGKVVKENKAESPDTQIMNLTMELFLASFAGVEFGQLLRTGLLTSVTETKG